MHFLTVTHDGDAFQLLDRTLCQESNGRGHVLQIDASIQQFFGDRQNHHILE